MEDFATKHAGKTHDMDLHKKTADVTNKGYAMWME